MGWGGVQRPASKKCSNPDILRGNPPQTQGDRQGYFAARTGTLPISCGQRSASCHLLRKKNTSRISQKNSSAPTKPHLDDFRLVPAGPLLSLCVRFGVSSLPAAVS